MPSWQWHLFSGDDSCRVPDALWVVLLLKSGAAMVLHLGAGRAPKDTRTPYVVNSFDVYSTCVPLNSAARIWYNWMHRARWTPCWAWTNSRQAADLSPPPSAVLFSHLCASPILLSIPLLLSLPYYQFGFNIMYVHRENIVWIYLVGVIIATPLSLIELCVLYLMNPYDIFCICIFCNLLFAFWGSIYILRSNGINFSRSLRHSVESSSSSIRLCDMLMGMITQPHTIATFAYVLG